jgi:hypothetical protein
MTATGNSRFWLVDFSKIFFSETTLPNESKVYPRDFVNRLLILQREQTVYYLLATCFCLKQFIQGFPKDSHGQQLLQNLNFTFRSAWSYHRRLCTVKNMLAMYLKYHKDGLTPTTPVTSISIFPVKMSIGCKSLTNLHSEMIFLQGKPIFSSPGL